MVWLAHSTVYFQLPTSVLVSVAIHIQCEPNKRATRIHGTDFQKESEMFNFLKKDTTKALQKAYERKLTEAQQAQRNGDIRTYSMLSEEADSLYKMIQSAKAEK